MYSICTTPQWVVVSESQDVMGGPNSVTRPHFTTATSNHSPQSYFPLAYYHGPPVLTHNGCLVFARIAQLTLHHLHVVHGSVPRHPQRARHIPSGARFGTCNVVLVTRFQATTHLARPPIPAPAQHHRPSGYQSTPGAAPRRPPRVGTSWPR